MFFPIYKVDKWDGDLMREKWENLCIGNMRENVVNKKIKMKRKLNDHTKSNINLYYETNSHPKH